MATEIRKTVCPHDCPDTCSILATIEDGRVTACDGDPDHPFTQGGLYHKVHRYAERIYSPLRILSPMRRVGAKGEGRFTRITWDEALDEVADRRAAHPAGLVLPAVNEQPLPEIPGLARRIDEIPQGGAARGDRFR